MRRYAITMGIRTACFLSLAFVRGWWMFIPAAGAIFLPYVAVVFANLADRRRSSNPEVPLERELPAYQSVPFTDDGAETIILHDAPAIEAPRRDG